MNAWITPDEADDNVRLISVTVPDDTYLYACFVGAVMLLKNPANWEQVGAMTPEECAAMFEQTFLDVIPDA